MNLGTFSTSAENISLFQTNAWREAWLSVWEPKASAEYTYRSRFKVKGLISIQSDYPKGCQSPALRSIRSEYFAPDVDNFPEYLRSVLKSSSHQVVFPDVIVNSPFHNYLNSLKGSGVSISVIEKNPDTAYWVETGSDSFEGYLASLSSNTRVKLFNRRKRLASMGQISFRESLNDESFINQLNNFHIERWGKPCYQGRNLSFIKMLLPLLRREGHEVFTSELCLDNKVVSLLLDIKVGSRIYNLQSGYLEGLAKGISLGLLHIGYNIENAFKDESVTEYDFMAGTGKNTNYKEKIATHYLPLIDVILVRNVFLKTLYKINTYINSACNGTT